MERFRGGLVFKAHRLLYHSTLGSRVVKQKEISICSPCTYHSKMLDRPIYNQDAFDVGRLCSNFRQVGHGSQLASQTLASQNATGNTSEPESDHLLHLDRKLEKFPPNIRG